MEIKPIDLPFSFERKEPKGGGSDFVQELKKFALWVDQEQKKAETIKEAVLKGADVPLHQMVVEFEKASLALNLLIQIRNKLVDAFQEINRMQV